MHRRFRLPELVALCWLTASGLSAQPPVATKNPAPPPGFAVRPSVLLTQRVRETFEEIRAACLHSRGIQDWTAVEWLLTTSQEYGWEADLDPITQMIPNHDPLNPQLSTQARAVRIVGLAQQGKAEDAVAAFETALKGVRVRQPQEMTSLAQALSLAFQLRGDLDAARTVYERVNEAFLLNTEVRDFATHRINRLALVGKPAPEVNLTDLNGDAVDWKASAGKVLVIDFWATDCRPCIEELPRLRRFYHDRDVERVDLLGISLDTDAADILQFRRQEPISWRIALDQKKATEAFHVVLIPCLIALDADGNVAAVDVPPRRLAATVHQLLTRVPAK